MWTSRSNAASPRTGPYVGGDVHPSTAWHAQFADVNHDGLPTSSSSRATSAHARLRHAGPEQPAAAAGRRLLRRGRAPRQGIASVRAAAAACSSTLNGDGARLVVVNRWDKGAAVAQPRRRASEHRRLQALAQPGGNRDAIGAWSRSISEGASCARS